MVSRTGRKELLAQCDYVRVVDVVPFHIRTGIQPEHPAIQAAPQMDYRGMLVNGQESGPQMSYWAGVPSPAASTCRNPEFAPVVVDSADRFLGEFIAQYGLVEVSVQRLQYRVVSMVCAGPLRSTETLSVTPLRLIREVLDVLVSLGSDGYGTRSIGRRDDRHDQRRARRKRAAGLAAVLQLHGAVDQSA